MQIAFLLSEEQPRLVTAHHKWISDNCSPQLVADPWIQQRLDFVIFFNAGPTLHLQESLLCPTQRHSIRRKAKGPLSMQG